MCSGFNLPIPRGSELLLLPTLGAIVDDASESEGTTVEVEDEVWRLNVFEKGALRCVSLSSMATLVCVSSRTRIYHTLGKIPLGRHVGDRGVSISKQAS